MEGISIRGLLTALDIWNPEQKMIQIRGIGEISGRQISKQRGTVGKINT